MDFGPEINTPEARAIAQQIYDEWINAGADPRLALYMVGVTYHESNQFDLNAHDQARARGLYQTDIPMWRHMQSAGGQIPSAADQTRIYLQHLKNFQGGRLWSELNASGGDPNRIFDAFKSTGEQGFAFDSRTRAPAAKYADFFSRVIQPAGASPEMARDYTNIYGAPPSDQAPFDQAGFNATMPAGQAPTSLTDQFIQGLTNPAALSPQQQLQQAINFQYSYPPSVSNLTNFQAPQDQGPMFGAGVPADQYQADYHAALPGLGAPFVEMGPSEASQFPGGYEGTGEGTQLPSDIATWDPNYIDPTGMAPFGEIHGQQGQWEPNYQMTGDFTPRQAATPTEGGTSGFDVFNWPTAEGMEPPPSDVYRDYPDTTDANAPDFSNIPSESQYQPTDEAISGAPDETAISGVSVPASEQGPDYGNDFLATGEPDVVAGDTTREQVRGDIGDISGEGRISEGPFSGMTPGEMESWHSGAGLGASGAEQFTGTTAGEGGQGLTYETTSYLDPQLGWVPQAQLANAQASTNIMDYLNPFSSPSGLSTTQKVGGAVGSGLGAILGSAIPIPGLGTFIGGKAGGMVGRWIGGMFHPASPQEQARAAAGLPPMPSGSVSLPTHDPYAPSAYSPTGEMGRTSPITGQTREWWSSDFGRGLDSGQAGQGPGDWVNTMGVGTQPGQFGTGFGTGTVGNMATAIGFGGNLGGGGPVNLSALGGWNNYVMNHFANAMMHGRDPYPPGTMKYPIPGHPDVETYWQGTDVPAWQHWSDVFRERGYVFAPQTGEPGTGSPPISIHTPQKTTQ